jgi:hypothetical protein
MPRTALALLLRLLRCLKHSGSKLLLLLLGHLAG